MNISEAIDTQEVIRALLGRNLPKPTIDALARLADRSHKTLMAGNDGDTVRAHIKEQR